MAMAATVVKGAGAGSGGRRTLQIVAVIVTATVVALALAGCGQAGTVTVTIQGVAYHPAVVTIQTGQTVEWVNRDTEANTVVSNRFGDEIPKHVGPNEMGSQPIEPGGTYSVTFTAPGTYPYHCVIHGYMHGVVIVR